MRNMGCGKVVWPNLTMASKNKSANMAASATKGSQQKGTGKFLAGAFLFP
jgi:hypothetical protein